MYSVLNVCPVTGRNNSMLKWLISIMRYRFIEFQQIHRGSKT